MRYKSVSPKLFIRNREKLYKHLNPGSLVIIHSNEMYPRNGDQFHSFRQNSDLFYLSGLDQEETIIVLFPDCNKDAFRETAFIRYSDEKTITWEGPKFSKTQAAAISGIKTIKWLSEYDIVLQSLMKEAEYVYLLTNEPSLINTDCLSKNHRLAIEMRQKYPLHKYERLDPIMTRLRLVKEKEEIALMKKAVEITSAAFNDLLSQIRPGMYEYEAEAILSSAFISRGATGHAYAPIIASGKNNLVLHYNQNDCQCKKGELLLLDFGAEYANYAADLSRTIPISGNFTKRQKEVYSAVLSIMIQAKELMIPGNSINLVNEQVGTLMEKLLVELKLLSINDIKRQDKENPAYRKFFMHGTSHFIGLDVHDRGEKDIVFENNMVLSCEPGIYIREEGFGIRLENDIIVAKNPVDLTVNIPITPEEIEEKIHLG